MESDLKTVHKHKLGFCSGTNNQEGAKETMNKILNTTKKLIYRLRHAYLDQFVFIHINKTGGSSVEIALKIPLEHKTALEKIEEIGQKRWEGRLTFTIVRNPWDKVVSHYFYRVKANKNDLRNTPVKFKEWVKLTYGNQDKVYYDNPKMFMPQADWITDENGKILVDYIIHFENLSVEFDEVLQKLGMTNITLPHVKKSNHSNFREYYDPETREIVQNWFERDVELFGYHFEQTVSRE
jgi:chondroitin 4-sulfotransferase 11